MSPPPTHSSFEVLLVVGIDAVGLARFPYLLYNAGCRVTLLSPPGFAVIRSRYVACYLPTSTDTKARVLHLKEVLRAQRQPFAQVIIGDEPTLIELAKYRSQDWLDGWFPIDHRSNAVEVTLCKQTFQQAAVAAGLKMPFSKLCHGWVEVESAVRSAGYPVMLKSSVGLSGSGVRKVCDSSELEPAYTQLATTNQPLLVQHFCEGMIGSTDVLFDQGLPVCWQSSYSLHCWPTPLASSSARILMQHTDIEAMISRVGQITGFHGFAGVDWIHDTTSDHLYLLELNPRPTPTYHLDRHSLVSFSLIFNQLLSGQNNVSRPEPIRQPTPRIRLFPQSLYWAVSERDWRSFILSWSDAPWNDPLLLCAYLRRVLTHFLPIHWRQKVKSWLKG